MVTTTKAKPKKPKSTAKLYKFKEEHKLLFEGVVFVVEATHHEQQQLWVNHYYEPRPDARKVQKWEQVMTSWLGTIGELDNRPVVVQCSWAILEGYRVLFYETTSQVVDYTMVDKWIRHFSESILWDGSRRAHTNASNFHHCLQAIRALVEEKGPGKDTPWPSRVESIT